MIILTTLFNVSIQYDDGHIEEAVCAYYIFKIIEDYAISNNYQFWWKELIE